MNYSSAYMYRQNPEHVFSVVLETNQNLQNSVSQGASTSHRGVKTDQGHKFQPLLVTLGPMTHEVTRPLYSKPSSPFLLSLSTQLSERSPPLCLLNFNGGEVQFSTHRARETSTQSKLYQPSSRPDWSRLLKPSKRQQHEGLPKNQHQSCFAQQNKQKQEPPTSETTSLDFKQHINLFPFSWMGNTTGLNNYTRLRKDFILFLVLFIIDLCCCDILVTSYL